MPRTQCWIRNCVSPRSWCNNQLSLMLFCHAQIIMVWPCLPVRGIPWPPSWVGCLFFWSAVSKFEDCVWCSRNHYFFLSADCVVSIFCDSVRATSLLMKNLSWTSVVSLIGTFHNLHCVYPDRCSAPISCVRVCFLRRKTSSILLSSATFNTKIFRLMDWHLNGFPGID